VRLRVNTAFGGSLTAADVGTGLVDFLAVCEVLLEIFLLCLFTPGSRHPGSLIQCYRVHAVKSAKEWLPA
jgi:hypothetical protein